MDISDLFDRPIAFQRPFVALGAGITGALLLSQAMYWSKRANKTSGWFYKTQTEWTEETGLTRTEQETARRKLKKMGVLLEKKQGVPCKIFFKIDNDGLRLKLASLFAGILQPVQQDSSTTVCGNPATCDAEIPQPYTETTTENTTESTTENYKLNKNESNGVHSDSELHFDFKSSRWKNTEDYLESWQTAYPKVNIEVQLAKAGLWLIEKKNTQQGRKQKYAVFLKNWFTREQKRQEKLTPSDFGVIDQNWEPSQNTKSYLERAGVPGDFIELTAMEFMLYWQERGEARGNWDGAFSNRCLDEWANPEKRNYFLTTFAQHEAA
ncbi:MAG: DnaT-like ssDNA-binding domain-containing protein [Bermanella sp.]